jgi:hypothetical protein
VALFLLILTVSSVYVSAQEEEMPTSVRFKGVLDTFYSDEQVKIVESKWFANLKKDGRVRFTASFTELNIEEDAPGDIVGGYDYFKMEMNVDSYDMDTEDGIYVFSGTMYVEKIGRDSFEWEDTEIYIHPDDWGNQLCIYYGDTWFFGSILPQ